ncbi:MAG: hypothetical protein RIF39_05140 [Cyclobacteriaceae bacterium]
MRFWFVIGVFTLVSSISIAQKSPFLANYSVTDGSNKDSDYQQKVELLIEKLDAKGKKTDRLFLKSVFNITHRQLLKEYDQYAGFGEIFKGGKYDCLTATALYSVLLNELGYPHRIIETNYHIFLLVDTNDGQVLMESTDPLDGFEYQPEKIESRIAQYKLDQEKAISNELNYPFSYSLFNEVTPAELTGLLYYNQCVKAFNTKQWSKAIQLLEVAKVYYNSPRIAEMENLLVQVVASTALENTAQPSSSTQRSTQQIAKNQQ